MRYSGLRRAGGEKKKKEMNGRNKAMMKAK
jgi:hypothetical protein